LQKVRDKIAVAKSARWIWKPVITESTFQAPMVSEHFPDSDLAAESYCR
jgi:hypothetical protein